MTTSPNISEAEIARGNFARHNFDNLQNLIRFVDTKAAALITIVIFLAASGIQIAKDSVNTLRFSSCRSTLLAVLFISGCIGFLLSFAWMSFHVQRVIAPRGATHYAEVRPGVNLMWLDHVIKHSTNAVYFDAVNSASAESLLRNVTDQIFELSHIAKKKMDAFHAARAAFWLAFVSWIIVIASGMFLTRWK